VTDGGRLTWNSSRPSPSTSTASTATRTSRETTWPQKNVHGGRGVPRSRLSCPLSRMIVNPITRPTNVPVMMAMPSMPGAKKVV